MQRYRVPFELHNSVKCIRKKGRLTCIFNNLVIESKCNTANLP